MKTLAQPLDTFIDEQIKKGAVSSVVEAEQMLVSALSERVLDRKISRAQEQVKNGQYYEANDDFVNDLLFEAGNRITTAN